MTAPGFRAADAFERNLGLITQDEQAALSRALVAIAGCGGVGGLHAHALARLGVGGFRLTDFDSFSLANFNRQVGATVETLGHNKAEVTGAMIRSINPEARVEIIEGGVTPANAADFVRGAALVVDGIDFFSIEPRRRLFAAARAAGVPAVTAAPLGFSATLHVFDPSGMSFDEYFDLYDGQPVFDQVLAFLSGLAPARLHAAYLDYRTVDPGSGRGPSSIVGTQLASCLVAAEAVRLLVGRGPSRAAPGYLQFDAYRQILRTGRLPRGNKGPIQRVKRALLKRAAIAMGWDAALKRRTE